MTDDSEVNIQAEYVQKFRIKQLAFEPQLAGQENLFVFESMQIRIRLPDMPNPDEVSDTNKPPNASIFHRRGAEILGVELHTVTLTMSGLHFVLPAEAAAYPGTNVSLYDTRATAELDQESNKFYYQASRAINYWLKIVRWRTEFPRIDRTGSFNLIDSDGGSLVNCDTGKHFWLPLVARTIAFLPLHTLRYSEWMKIDESLKTGSEPPIWHDCFIDAHQRLQNNGIIGSFLDLVIAAEARIRSKLNDLLSGAISTQIKNIPRIKMSDIFRKWAKLGFPEFPPLGQIKLLFKMRNSIMHSGKDDRAIKNEFFVTADAVRQLIAILFRGESPILNVAGTS